MINNISAVKSKEEFVDFVASLLQDHKDNTDDWENNTLELFLHAIMSWTEDMDGFYKNSRQPMPTNVNWKVFAEILMAGKMYK